MKFLLFCLSVFSVYSFSMDVTNQASNTYADVMSVKGKEKLIPGAEIMDAQAYATAIANKIVNERFDCKKAFPGGFNKCSDINDVKQSDRCNMCGKISELKVTGIAKKFEIQKQDLEIINAFNKYHCKYPAEKYPHLNKLEGADLEASRKLCLEGAKSLSNKDFIALGFGSVSSDLSYLEDDMPNQYKDEELDPVQDASSPDDVPVKRPGSTQN